jgi:hypothetical protein
MEMKKNMNIFTRMELLFWNSTIRLLSHPSFTQLVLKREFSLSSLPVNSSLALLFALTGAVGLLSGYLFYFVTAGLR